MTTSYDRVNFKSIYSHATFFHTKFIILLLLLLKLVNMAEETIPLTPLSDHDNEEELSNQPTPKPSNKRSRKQKSSEHVPKKVRTLEKTHKYKSWVWKWWEPVLLDNRNTGAECLVKITDERLCGKLYLNGNSTSNLIMHLAGSHQITENTDIKEKSVS